MKTLTQEEFIKKANAVHNNFYDYTISIYNGCRTKIKIICPVHGEFEQVPYYHLQGSKCPKCANFSSSKKRKKPIEVFIKKSNIIHNHKYDYSLVEYKNNTSKIKIICPIHGEFEQMPVKHLNKKQGCPMCRESQGEKEIAKLLTEINISFERQKRFDGCRNINPLPFDFYIPSKNVILEFQGRQHYETVEIFGNDLEYIQNNDNLKKEYCIKNNIQLLTIKYDENIEEKVLSLLA